MAAAILIFMEEQVSCLSKQVVAVTFKKQLLSQLRLDLLSETSSQHPWRQFELQMQRSPCYWK